MNRREKISLGGDSEGTGKESDEGEAGFSLVCRGRLAVCCADEQRGGTRRSKSNRSETGGNGGGTWCGTSGAVLSELFGRIEGEQLQVELSAVRVLFELLGFLLNGMVAILRGGGWSPEFFATDGTEGHRVEHAGASII